MKNIAVWKTKKGRIGSNKGINHWKNQEISQGINWLDTKKGKERDKQNRKVVRWTKDNEGINR